MNRKLLLQATVLLVLHLFPCDLRAFIQFEDSPTAVSRALYRSSVSPSMMQMVQSLERITGLKLQVEGPYLKVEEPERLPILYASSEMRDVFHSTYPDLRWSPTARHLLLSAIRSTTVYRVRENSGASLGRVDYRQTIELDFGDLNRITYRDVPRETFDAGMIFLHELVHRHLNQKDPAPEEIKRDPSIKGPTVEYVNRIERELGLPERRHYAPMKIRFVREEAKWGVYFGNDTDRVEFDSKFVLR